MANASSPKISWISPWIASQASCSVDTWPEDADTTAPAETDFVRWFSPELLYLDEDGLTLEFPAGTLEEDGPWLFPFSYQELEGILQPWAMPE